MTQHYDSYVSKNAIKSFFFGFFLTHAFKSSSIIKIYKFYKAKMCDVESGSEQRVQTVYSSGGRNDSIVPITVVW